jgi:hypothetical protein
MVCGVLDGAFRFAFVLDGVFDLAMPFNLIWAQK